VARLEDNSLEQLILTSTALLQRHGKGTTA